MTLIPVMGQSDYSQEMDRMRSQIGVLELKSTEIRNQRDSLLKKVDIIDQEVAAIEDRRINALDDLQKEDLSQQDTRRAKYLQLLEYEQRTVALNATLPFFLEASNHPIFTQAIRDRDINRLTRSKAYLRYLAQSQSRRIQTLHNSLHNQTTADEIADFSSLMLRTEELKQELAERNNAKLSIQREVEKLNQQLVSNQASIRQLSKELDHLVNQSAMQQGQSGNPTTAEKLYFSAPIDAQVRRKFGDPKKAYGGQWTGLLYQAQEGQTVRAAASGVVIFAKEYKTLGNLIIIDHGEELFTLYAHNSELSVRLGDSVEAGQSIAKAGSSGDVSGPSLYFEIRHRGEPVDPLPRIGG